MPKYNVTLPFVGALCVDDVEADSEQEAIEKAMEMVDVTVEDGPESYVTEWSTVEAVTRGNVCYAPVNDARAEPES